MNNKMENDKDKSAWSILGEKELEAVESFSEAYKSFLNKGKTEREAAVLIEQKALENGFVNLYEESPEAFDPSGRYYAVNRGKSLVLVHLGTDDLEAGANIVGGHLDSPRLDLKQNPLYEDSELALFKTHYYGGIKKYQWTSLPMALHGIVIREDGEKVEIAIGEAQEDPVFFITDLLPHLAKDQNQKKLSEAITGEGLNLTVGNRPAAEGEKDKVKGRLLEILKETHGITEEDFAMAELEIVPAGPARDAGLDRSMITGYGQDDRSCSYAAMEALFKVKAPKRTAVALFADKEEIGSVGNTGMLSSFFENFMAEILFRRKGAYNELMLRRFLEKSLVVSADVVNGFDPNYPEVSDKLNSAYLGRGVSFSKYGGSRGKYDSNDANAEYLAKVRRLLNRHHIAWQTAEMGKVDQGGGGTIAYILANRGAEVVDAGLPVLSMHAPFELISKVDLYMAFRAYEVFLKEMS